MGVEEYVAMLRGFEDLDVRGEVVGEEEGEIEHELLIRVGGRFVGTSDVCA